MTELDLNEGLDFLRRAGMTVLSADKASDIDNWPSLDSLVGAAEPRGLIHLVMSTVRLTRSSLHNLAHDRDWELPILTMEYPEKMLLRGQIEDEVGNWVVQCKAGALHTIITDSDFILNALRIAVKEGRLTTDELYLTVVTQSKNGLSMAFFSIDSDGRFDIPPDLLGFYASQLRRLL